MSKIKCKPTEHLQNSSEFFEKYFFCAKFIINSINVDVRCSQEHITDDWFSGALWYIKEKKQTKKKNIFKNTEKKKWRWSRHFFKNDSNLQLENVTKNVI